MKRKGKERFKDFLDRSKWNSMKRKENVKRIKQRNQQKG